jgi:hypothetical protein
MGRIELDIHEGTSTEDIIAPKTAEIVLQKYQVTVESGIFKRGKLWKNGSIIELDKVTGQRFVNNKELKEIK